MAGGYRKTLIITLRRYYLCRSILLCLWTSTLCGTTARWTVLTYAQANNILSSYAYKNFSDMALIGSSSDLNILVEWHQPEKEGIWRYRIEKGKMIVDMHIPEKTDGCSSKNLVDAMQWAVTKYPAKQYALILWNHGSGILDPVWGNSYRIPRNEPCVTGTNFMRDISQIQLEGFTPIARCSSDVGMVPEHKNTSSTHDTVVTSTGLLSNSLSQEVRGILFNEHTRTYMDNQSLAKALSEIRTKVLKKKLDLLGMDACLMAMLEVAWQVKQHVGLLVASQEVELAYGWNYLALLGFLAQKECSPVDVAKQVVDSYGQYYKNRLKFYTQSAINVDKVEGVKIALDDIVEKLKACRYLLKDSFSAVIKKARKSCVQFSSVHYIDLHSFLAELLKQGDMMKTASGQQRTAIELLKETLQRGMRSVEDAVIANATGENFTRAQGLSIYFPRGGIDPSYPKTLFAQESSWFSFIQEACRF